MMTLTPPLHFLLKTMCEILSITKLDTQEVFH
jgi:hypothetical protein